MRIEHHIVISTTISGILYAILKSWEMSIAAFMSGVFIDIDHLFDYWAERGLRFNVKELLPFFYEEKHTKITLIFHGWELLIILCIASSLTGYNSWITGLSVGYGHHIILDYANNKTSFKSYSLLWRWKNRFDSKLIFPRNRGYNPKVRNK